MPKKITAYQCEYGCGFYRITKKSVINHEKWCFWNPARRACASCENREEYEETIYNPYHGGNPGSTDYEIKCVWCSVYETDLYKKENLKHDCPKWAERDKD